MTGHGITQALNRGASEGEWLPDPSGPWPVRRRYLFLALIPADLAAPYLTVEGEVQEVPGGQVDQPQPVWLGVTHSEPTPTAVTSRHLPTARTAQDLPLPCGARDDGKMIKVRQRQDWNTPRRLASPQTAPTNKVDAAPSEAYHLGRPRTPELGDLRAPTRAARTAVSRTDSAGSSCRSVPAGHRR
jgi:hypothetical protein